MITVNIHDVPSQIPHLLAQALAGESVIVCEGNVPVLEMKPVPHEPQKRRKPSLGNPPFPMTFSEDAFEPLPEEIWNVFNGYDDKHGL